MYVYIYTFIRSLAKRSSSKSLWLWRDIYIYISGVRGIIFVNHPWCNTTHRLMSTGVYAFLPASRSMHAHYTQSMTSLCLLSSDPTPTAKNNTTPPSAPQIPKCWWLWSVVWRSWWWWWFVASWTDIRRERRREAQRQVERVGLSYVISFFSYIRNNPRKKIKD